MRRFILQTRSKILLLRPKKKGAKNTTEETPIIKAMVIEEPSKCDTTKTEIIDSAAASTTPCPVEDTPTINKVPKSTPCLERIMEMGSLERSLSEIQDFDVGGFKVVGVISELGANGLVVSCTDAANNSYAMKIERKKHSMKTDNIALHEVLESCLNKEEDDLYIPRLRTSFREQGKKISVMELLGPDLLALQNACEGKFFSRKTTMQIGLSLITAYEQIHRGGWLHLTTKPINFCIGGTLKTHHKVYAIDFGRAEKYIVKDEYGRDCHRSEHASGVGRYSVYKEFSSVWKGAKCAPSRRDDMMSLVLMLMYLEGNMSPWAEKGLTKVRWIYSLQLRETTMWESLLVRAWHMEFDERPCYKTWRQTIRNWAAKEEIKLDGRFDWDYKLKQGENGRVILGSD